MYLGKVESNTFSIVVLETALQEVDVLPHGNRKVPKSKAVYLLVPWDRNMLQITTDRELLLVFDYFERNRKFRLVFLVADFDGMPRYPHPLPQSERLPTLESDDGVLTQQSG